MLAAAVTLALLHPAAAAAPRETRVPVDNTSLYAREIGSGRTLVVLHGGPDFDHAYLLPELDQLADAYRLIYYDQRGRGRSAERVRPEDVSVASDVADLDAVREHFGQRSAALLAHSWGVVLALEYARRHPDRVSRLVLMNPAPASAADLDLLKRSRREHSAADVERLNFLRGTDGYKRGDPDAVAAYYRVHFKAAMRQTGTLDEIVERLRRGFTADGILEARAIEGRLVDETWGVPGYDLLPKLAKLEVPTLVVNGDDVFIPPEIAEHIAHALPNARLVVLKNCGHFSYLECPGALRQAIDAFFRTGGAR
jgi:proline iminopeptidase